MGCSTCSVSATGTPTGCGDKGHCSSGSCNKKNTFDWLTTLEINDPLAYQIVEVSFKKGNRKGFYINPPHSKAITGDMVVVESTSGYDVGRIGLSGDLVRLQMKKKKTEEASVLHKVIRVANFRDLEKLEEARSMEKKAMIRARAITKTLDLNMKIGDVEYQGDKRKATFYYTANGRVDFRELVRMYAKEFRVKIEMKQIGSRQESSLIGGLGTCGRELCCSTWKSTFETVTTTAARYQNLAINQTKLTGQCGRLKCCLNYELDTYLDALGDFPKKADTLKLEGGYANLVKTDIFKGIMFYSISKDNIRGPLLAIDKDQVKKLQALNKKGILIKDINAAVYQAAEKEEINEDNIEHDFADVTGEIELPAEKRRKKSGRNNRKGNRNKSRGRSDSRDNKGRNSNKKSGGQDATKKPDSGPSAEKKDGKPNNRNKKRRPNRNNKRKGKPNTDNANKPNKGDSDKTN
jgi:cell fate regulator YaaT (PSP1 superfamily)